MKNNKVYYEKIESKSGHQSLCIVAGYDPNSIIESYVYHLLNSLKLELKADVVYVTTSENVSDVDKQKMSTLGISLIHRSNVGYDFMSYAVGFKTFAAFLDNYDYLYHANDSVYGPFSSIASINCSMNDVGLDVWGMTDSYERKYHIQSYFVCFKKTVFQKLQEFWKDYNYSSNYNDVVNNGEIGLSQYLIKNNFDLGAAFPVDKYMAKYLQDCRMRVSRKLWKYFSIKIICLNPSIYLWKDLMEDGYPFLKRKMLNDLSCLDRHMGAWINCIDVSYAKSIALTRASINRSIGAVSIAKGKNYTIYKIRNYIGYKKYKKKYTELVQVVRSGKNK